MVYRNKLKSLIQSANSHWQCEPLERSFLSDVHLIPGILHTPVKKISRKWSILRVKVFQEYLDRSFVTIIRKDRDIINQFVRSNLDFYSQNNYGCISWSSASLKFATKVSMSSFQSTKTEISFSSSTEFARIELVGL